VEKDNQYWAKDEETLPRAELEKLQVEKLNGRLAYLEKHSDFYRRKFEKCTSALSGLKSIEHIRDLPFTDRDEIYMDQQERGRLGSLMCTSFEESGHTIGMTGVKFSTSGKPLRIIMSIEDAAWQGRLAARGLSSAGIKPDDYLYLMDFPQLNLLYMHLGLGSINLGSKSILVGMERSERNTSIYSRLYPPTCFYISPSYSKMVTQMLKRTGRKFPIHAIMGWSEPGYSIPVWRERFTQMWLETTSESTVELYDVYGLVELGLLGFECSAHNGLHGFEDAYIYEVIDPDTKQVLAPGQEGELVVTHLERTAMPLIRYRTGDITAIETAQCNCGRTHLRLSGIKGRLEQSIIVNGRRIYQSQIEEAIGGVKEYSGDFNIMVAGEEVRNRLDINILRNEVTERSKSEMEDLCTAKLGVPVQLHLKEKGDLIVFIHRSQKIINVKDVDRLKKEAASQLKAET
jgi:phenylacetate-CoA ligase